jgi:hypothetical protein
MVDILKNAHHLKLQVVDYRLFMRKTMLPIYAVSLQLFCNINVQLICNSANLNTLLASAIRAALLALGT